MKSSSLAWIPMVAVISCGATVEGGETETNTDELVYGNDDRSEYLSISDPQLKKRADATVGLMPASWLSCSGGNCSLAPLNHYLTGDVFGVGTLPLCTGVPFKGQWGKPYCTAFLVGPDTFVTAGHCLVPGYIKNNPVVCSNPGGTIQAAFGFTADAAGNAPTSLPQANVYTCTSATGKFTDNEDWAVFKVDRPVTGPVPLVPQYGGELRNSELAVFGHGEGLPLKMSKNAFVKVDTGTAFFGANSDIFGGNSGGPSVNIDTLVVTGISSYVTTGHYVAVPDGLGGQCATPKVCSDASGCPGWSGHTRLTWVAAQTALPLHAGLGTSAI